MKLFLLTLMTSLACIVAQSSTSLPNMTLFQRYLDNRTRSFLTRYQCRIQLTQATQSSGFGRWTYVTLNCANLGAQSQFSSVLCESCQDPVTCDPLENVRPKPVTRRTQFNDTSGTVSYVDIPVACVCEPIMRSNCITE